MDAAEIDRFRAWIAKSDAHARAFEQRRRLWQQIGDHPQMFASPYLPPRRAGGRRRWMPRRRNVATGLMAVAASVMAVLIAPEALIRFSADHRATSRVSEQILPDGSIAWLDAGTAIRVDFDGTGRRVALLRGNAFFAVRHGDARPFRVAALDGMVEDIGTRFEVRRQEARVDIAVADGTVRVVPGARRSWTTGMVLRAGEAVAYGASGRILPGTRETVADVAAWRRGELMIDRRPVQDVVRAIGRYRKGPTWIWGDLADAGPVNGAFRIDDADAALRDLAAGQRLSILWLPGDIAIVMRTGDAR